MYDQKDIFTLPTLVSFAQNPYRNKRDIMLFENLK